MVAFERLFAQQLDPIKLFPTGGLEVTDVAQL
jgi:hypothetical protein